MTVSVIVPTRDYRRYLGRAIDSLRGQSHSDWQCVVVDDGSSDGTAELIRALAKSDRRITYSAQHAAGPSTGPSAARNTGLAAASGEFVQFLDADDLLGPGKLQRQIDVFAEHPEADIVYGGVRYFTETDPDDGQNGVARSWIDGPIRRVVSGSGESVLAALVDDNIMVIEAPLIRRSLFERIGRFDPRIRRMEDWEFWLRCALAGASFVHDGATQDDDLPHVRVHRASSSQNQIAMHKAAARVRAGVETRLPTPALRRLNRKRIHEHWAIVGMLEGMGGHPGLGMRHLLKAGFAEKNVKWLAWGVLMPVVRRPPGSWAMNKLRSTRARRRGEEVRDWQTHWP